MGAGKSDTRGRTRVRTHTCEGCVQHWLGGRIRATGGMGAGPNSREFKELSRNMGEGENATRKCARVRAHTCQPGGEAMGTCLDQERGEMGMAAGERWAGAGVKGAY